METEKQSFEKAILEGFAEPGILFNIKA